MSKQQESPRLKQQIKSEDIAEIVRDLHAPDQTRATRAERAIETLCQDLWDLEYRTKAGRSRKEQLQLIANIHKNISTSICTLGNTDPVLDETLGRLLGRRLAEILGVNGIAAVYPDAKPYLPKPHARESDLPARQRESYAAGDQAATEQFAVEHCAPILERLLQAIDQPLSDLLEIESERIDGGGRPVYLYRNFIIKRVAAIYHDALGEPATPTEGNLFEAFCEGVLGIVGIDDTGLHSAIKRTLPKLGP